MLSLAGVSPALHSWLHADTNCAHTCGTDTEENPPPQSDATGHYCGVIALQGTVVPAIILELPERSVFERIHFESLSRRLLSHASDLRLQARAPPIEV